jgi:predicted ATPase
MSQPPDQREPQGDASLHKISIQNFKAFGEMVDVPIRPITLIFGENSSGKSSILHSLLFLNQMQYQPQEQLADITYTKIGGNSVDLGGIPQLLYKHSENNKLHFRIEVVCDLPKLGLQYDSRILDLLRDIPDLKTFFILTIAVTLSKKYFLEQIDYFIDTNLICSLSKFELLRPMRFTKSQRVRYTIGNVNEFTLNLINKYLYFHYSLKKSRTMASNSITAKINRENQTIDAFLNVIKKINNSHSEYRGSVALNIISNSSALLFDIKKNAFHHTINNSDLSETENNTLSNFTNLFLNAILNLNSFAQISNITYLGPIRTIPTRNFDTLDSINRDPSTGSTAWDKLANDDRLRARVNRWLARFGTNKQISTEQLVDTAQLRKIVSESVSTTQIEDIIKQLATRNLLRFYDPQKDIHLSHRDLGVGISQVLPVLVNSIANSDTTVLIEQPELHLHPRLQGDLADLFIDTAIKGEQQNTFIIETHSEHIIRRIMRRIREDQHKSAKELLRITKEDVAILYVASGPNGSTVTHLRLDDEGDLIDEWPNGFFEESFRDDIAGR